MKLAEVAAASRAAASTRSRRAKASGLAEVLSRAAPDEIEAVVGFLSGELRQGRVGVGAALLWSVEAAPAAAPSLEVLEVDEAISRIPGITGRGSRARRLELLAGLLGRATAGEQQFIRRLLTGELRHGALEGLMMEAVAAASGVGAAAVRRAAMLGGGLGSIALPALTEGEGALLKMRIELMRPVRPMLAASSPSVEAAVEAAGKASVEWKMDGARIQVHRQGGRTAVFTRSLNEVTDRMPLATEAALRLPVSSVVLDGEALTLDERGLPRRFEQTMSRFGSRTPAGGAPLLPFFFDILHLNGRDLIDLPLSERIEILERTAPAEHLVPRMVTDRPSEAAAAFAEARRHRHEGIMVKAVDSTYQAGRRGSAWLKVKPAHHLDLVVLAAEWGHGRRTGWLSNLHLGARDAESGGFVMVARPSRG